MEAHTCTQSSELGPQEVRNYLLLEYKYNLRITSGHTHTVHACVCVCDYNEKSKLDCGQKWMWVGMINWESNLPGLKKFKCMMHFPAYSHHLVNWLQCPSGSPCLQVIHSDALSQHLYLHGVSDSCLFPWQHKLGSSPTQLKDSCSLLQSHCL